MCSRVKEEWGRGLQRLPPVSRMGGRQGVVATRRARLSAIVSVANATTGAMSVRIVFDTFRQPLFLVERPASAPFVVEVSGVRPLFLSLQLGRGKQVLQCLATNSVLGPTLGGSGGPTQRNVRWLLDEWRSVGATACDIVRIAPAAANQILIWAWKFMHLVIITRRVNWDRLASRRRLSNCLAAAKMESVEALVCSPSAELHAPKEPRRANAVYLPEMVIDLGRGQHAHEFSEQHPPSCRVLREDLRQGQRRTDR